MATKCSPKTKTSLTVFLVELTGQCWSSFSCDVFLLFFFQAKYSVPHRRTSLAATAALANGVKVKQVPLLNRTRLQRAYVSTHPLIQRWLCITTETKWPKFGALSPSRIPALAEMANFYPRGVFGPSVSGVTEPIGTICNLECFMIWVVFFVLIENS